MKKDSINVMKAADLRLRSLAKEMQLGTFCWDEWKNYRDQGRK
jgi:hypothetical protein